MLVFLIVLLCTVVYAVPGLIATGRKHPKAWRVWLVNILLGFTVVGWLWSLREALRPDAVPYRKVYYRYSYYGEESRKKRFDMRQLPLGDVGMAMVGLIVVALGGTLGWRHFGPQPEATGAVAATVDAPQGWTYALESGDAGPVHVSTLMSNDADAGGDGLPAALVLRSGHGEPSAAIRIDGEFTCSAAANGTIGAQFDGGPMQTLHCAPRPADTPNVGAAGQDMLFLADPDAFIARARTARSLVLTASVLGQGVKHAHFSPQGLDLAMAGWPEDAVAVGPIAKPAAAEAPAVVQTVAASTPVRPKSPRTFETAKATRSARAHPVRTAVRTTAHRDRHTVLHPFRPQGHHKSWHD